MHRAFASVILASAVASCIGCAYAHKREARHTTYPVAAAFEHGGPRLTATQRAWIRRILHSKNYGKFRATLRFAEVPGSSTPVVVYIDRSVPKGDVLLPHIIGERCNSLFDPEIGVIAGSETSCDAPTPKPVDG